jgi:translocation and assembly module TamA
MSSIDVRRAWAALLCRAGLLLLLAPTAARAATLDVSVQGLTGAVRDNVLGSLSIYQERGRGDLTDARIRQLHATATEEIRTALQPFGYYRPKVDASLDVDQKTDHWTARYAIEPGPPLSVTKVEVHLSGEGSSDDAFQTLRDRFPISRGEPLNQAAYEQAKKHFQSVAAERGYFDLRFTRHEIRIDLETYQAQIYLDVDTGVRYRFGDLYVEQNLLTPDLIRRYVRISPGDYYTTQALLDAQNALTASNYFTDVQVDADRSQARDHTIPITIHLKPRPQNKYSAGLGYGTDTGVRGQLGWERYYLNPQGHHARIDLRDSQIDRSLTAGYFIPIRNPRNDQLGFTGGFEETDTDTATNKTRRLAVSRTNVRGHLLEVLSLTYQVEEFDVSGQTGNPTLVLPGVNWTYYWGNERIYTRSGASAMLDLRGAAETLGSDISMRQARFQLRDIFPVATFGRVITRFDVGHTNTKDFTQLPASLRFFAGGDTSVRGYAYNTLGPVDAQGNVIGGPDLLVGSVEYEQHLSGNWSAAVFYDTGNALNSFRDPLRKGAGIGVRYRTPVGEIRVDIAEALSEPGHPRRFHIYFGPDL